MICYRDRCFCPFWRVCRKGKVCDRALTVKVTNSAIKAGLPIQQYSNFPDCFVEAKPKDED